MFVSMFEKINQTFCKKHLVGKIKSTTFAPALREATSLLGGVLLISASFAD
jgi:hypothetical protein